MVIRLSYLCENILRDVSVVKQNIYMRLDDFDNIKKLIIINKFLNRQTKKMYIFLHIVYTHTEPKEHQKAVLPRHVVPHEAENLAS